MQLSVTSSYIHKWITLGLIYVLSYYSNDKRPRMNYIQKKNVVKFLHVYAPPNIPPPPQTRNAKNSLINRPSKYMPQGVLGNCPQIQNKTEQNCTITHLFLNCRGIIHPRRPRGSQSGREKGRDESFQVGAKEPLGIDSHRAISKNSSECRLLIGHKKCFVLLCPIGKQFLLSSFREFIHDGYCFDHGLSGSCTKEMHAVRKLSV